MPTVLGEAPKPHWSHLPAWGVAAAERGHVLPLPFGIGINYYSEKQPFAIDDLQIPLDGGDPVSVKDFAEIDQVTTQQSSLTGRLDAWLFPFLNVYGVFGYTSGDMTGTVGLPAILELGIPAQQLPLAISYSGPTYGGGGTIAGGFKVSDWRSLTTFAVVDAKLHDHGSFVQGRAVVHKYRSQGVCLFDTSRATRPSLGEDARRLLGRGHVPGRFRVSGRAVN